MAELKFYCRGCGKKLDIFETYHLPGEDIYDELSGIRFNSGSNYCKECYEARLTPLPKKGIKPEYKDSRLEKIDKIKDLKAGESNINLFVEVTDKKETKVRKKEKGLRLGLFKIKDKTGEVELVLWEKTVDWIKKGDQILLRKCFIRTFKGEKQVTLGKNGKIVRLND